MEPAILLHPEPYSKGLYRFVLASLLVMSGSSSRRWAGELWPALASFPDPKIPIQTCLLLSTYKHRFACFLMYGDRYFVYRQIYPFSGEQRGRHMHEYTAYAPGTLLYLRCIYMSVSNLVTTYRALSLGMTNRHGRWVCWMSMGLNTHSKEQRGTCG